MIKLVLDLRSKTDAAFKQYSANHIAKMAGNATFPTPVPGTVPFQALHDAYSTALTDADGAQQTAQQKTSIKDTARLALEVALTQRASNIEGTPGLTEAQALSTGFGIKAGAAPVGPMTAPQSLSVTGGDLEGQNDLHWNPVNGRTSYIGEQSGSATGPWTQFYVGKKSSCTASGLTPGALNYFRIRAVGAAGPGPWSDLAQGRAT